jgi:hypothetical protein
MWRDMTLKSPNQQWTNLKSLIRIRQKCIKMYCNSERSSWLKRIFEWYWRNYVYYNRNHKLFSKPSTPKQENFQIWLHFVILTMWAYKDFRFDLHKSLFKSDCDYWFFNLMFVQDFHFENKICLLEMSLFLHTITYFLGHNKILFWLSFQ